jgi:hypothetical protein
MHHDLAAVTNCRFSGVQAWPWLGLTGVTRRDCTGSTYTGVHPGK